MRRHSVAFADFEISNPRSSLTVSATLLYTMTHLFCGIVFPLSDSFVAKRDSESDHTYYLETFLIIQYLTAMLSIFFLQLYIFVYERILKEKGIPNNDNEIKAIVDDFAEQYALEIPETSNKQVTFDINKIKNIEKQQSEFLEKDENCSLQITKIDENFSTENDISANVIPIENENSDGEVSLHNDNIVDKNVNECLTDIDNQNSLLERKISNTFLSSNDVDEDSVKSGVPFYRDAEGINLYLRLGAVGFGFGVMVHDGFKIADQFRIKNVNCLNALWIPKQVLHLAFIFVQTFFIFKYHRINFQRYKSIVRLILWHLAIINICQWFKTVVYEINHELYQHEYISSVSEKDNLSVVTESSHFESNATDAHMTNCYNQLSFLVSPYLFPCAIEYSLISAAIFYKMLQKVGRKFEPSYWVNESDDDHAKYSECHRSHKGLFIGLLFFMATLVGLVIFIMFQKKSSTKQTSILVYQFSEITLLASSIFALIICFIKMRVLSFRPLTEEEALDDNLLLVGLSGIFAYNLFLLISTIDTIIRNKANHYYFTIVLFMVKSSTEIIQSLLQVLFVLEASRKYSKFHIHVHKKPGRSFVTFLIISNLALWIVSIFETKRADQHQVFNKYFQNTPWSIITHTLLPLIIFFRFHSTVCLTDIWSKSYKARVRKTALSKRY